MSTRPKQGLVNTLTAKRNTTNCPELPGTNTSAAMEKLAVWKEFRAGMDIMHRYAKHSRANSDDIAKSNLQLLHRSLLSDPLYRRSIEKASCDADRHGLPTLQKLLATQEIRAELVSVCKGCSIPLTPCDNGLAMFLAVSGTARVNRRDAQPTSGSDEKNHKRGWWSKSHPAQMGKPCKTGDVVLVSPGQTGADRIEAVNQNCVFLSVTLPLPA